MLKRKLHISFLSLLFLAGVRPVSSQINVNLPQANITSRTDFAVNLFSGNYSALIGLLPNVQVKANSATFTRSDATETLPLGVLYLRAASLGGIALLTGSQEIQLSMAYQTTYASLASLPSSPFNVDYRVVTNNTRWLPGVYTTPIQIITGIASNRISPNTPNLSITVPAFISPVASLGTVNMAVNSFALFRAVNGVSVLKTIPVSNTVPYTLDLTTGSNLFNFSTGLPANVPPATAVSSVTATLAGSNTAGNINLSSSLQLLSTSAGIAVPLTNNETLSTTFAINGVQLRQGFVQAGTYVVPITLSWKKLNATFPVGDLQVSRMGNLQVTVSDLSEVVVNQTNVSMAFTSAADYQQGVARQMPAHIKISKTTPYNLYVRALSPDFNSGSNQIPLNVLRVGPMAGQTGMNTVTLSTTPQQLINAADPVIDRNLDVLYSIPASETNKLLGKPAGSYNTTVVFSFVAL